MMLYPAMTKLNVVARRARQIALEAEENGEILEEKPVTMAINEVAEGLFDASTIDTGIDTDNN